ncbi:acyl-CoA thioesterase [Winogradskyella sp. E313]|nr:acyl-CoA thioesterase [Winogradskyella immobilis]
MRNSTFEHQYNMMQIYQKQITVTKDDLDQLLHVNNVRYVQWVQDIAEEHWLKNASQEILDSCFWVLINHNISYKAPALLGDSILIKTFILKSEGVSSVRKVEMYNQTSKKQIIDSETTWCLVSSKSKRPTRITSEIVNLFN